MTLLHVSEDAHVNKHCRRRNTTEAEDPKPRGVAIVVTHARNNALSRKARKTPLALRAKRDKEKVTKKSGTKTKKRAIAAAREKRAKFPEKTPPRGARFLVPADHNFDNFRLRRARGPF